MALIRRFNHEDRKLTLHKEIAATYFVQEVDGATLVQIDMKGRPDRAFPDKVSQTIQLDRSGAEQLVLILQKAFNLK